MNVKVKLIDDNFLLPKKIYGLNHYYFEFNKDKFSNQIVVCINILEHFNNIELLKFSIWCKRHNTRVVAYGNINEFPLFGIFADAAIVYETKDNFLYEHDSFYNPTTTDEVIEKIYTESIYFPARLSFLNQREWEINEINRSDIIGEFIGCHVINLSKLTGFKPAHFLLEIADKEVSDEEVVEKFTSPIIYIRNSSFKKYEILKEKGLLGENWIVGEIKQSSGCHGGHLISVLESKIKDFELPFILDKKLINELSLKCGSNYMEIQLLSSLLLNWMWICYGGSSHIFSFFPVKVLSLSDASCLPELSRKISIARFGEYIGRIFPEFETLIYCMPGEEDGVGRTDGHPPLPNIRKMIKDFSKFEIKAEFVNAPQDIPLDRGV